jgi:hypothetical protein
MGLEGKIVDRLALFGYLRDRGVGRWQAWRLSAAGYAVLRPVLVAGSNELLRLADRRALVALARML